RWPVLSGRYHVIRGGHEYEFFRPVRAEDQVRVTWRLADVRETRASSGVPMLIVQSEGTYRSATGELLAINRETMLFQEAP
ncbi:MAG: MaoC family dehydratase N-terminal domain-containing protein, partial [Planctomycetes bacterium]|nr:MaoC family dehydratase N-terminal domain-containing protein [Planctomycetota bacterium]